MLDLVTTHLADPRNKSRKRLFCDARTIFSAIARKEGLSYKEIADMLGKHRTTIYAYDRLCNPKNLGKNYEIYEKILNEIRNQNSPGGKAPDDQTGQVEEADSDNRLLVIQG